VVGGGAGGRLNIEALIASDHYDLLAVCDWNPEALNNLRERYPDIITYRSQEELFAKSPTDVVCVATWPTSHKKVVSAAMELPLKGIIVEKPLAHSLSEAKVLLRGIKEKRLPVGVPHGLLVAHHSTDIITRVQRGDIGTLKLAEVQCEKWDLMNAGIHWLDFFVTLLPGEDPVHVVAQCDKTTRTYRDDMQVETVSVTYVQTNAGTRLVMNMGDYIDINRNDKSTLLRLVGTKGLIEFWGWESVYYLFNGEYPEGKIIEIEPFERTNHQIHLENLAEQIDRSEPDYTIAENSLKALELVEAAYLSARHGVRVDLPIDRFVLPEFADWDPGRPYSGNGGGRDGRKLP
jgi:predicted dehydrogenase